MAEKKVISDFEAQIRQLIADHRRLTALCKGNSGGARRLA